YDDRTGERVELSTTTLANWVAKTINLLVLECGVGPGATISLHLPRHWITAVWVLAADAVGAEVHLGAAGQQEVGGGSGHGRVDIAVIGPELVRQPPDADEVFAVSLAPLAAPFSTPLPPLVRDFTVDVRLMPDQVAGPVGPAGELGAAAEASAGALGIVTTDRVAALGSLEGINDVVDQWLAPLAVGASVVWVGNPEAERCVSRWASERVTAVAGNLPDGMAAPDSIRILA
ncbi:MAG TPA: TIGR03089 family protein, partial [Actinomycetes bacterium]|nr:TIGR03089 family protein [Actinomycetes bacterium]